MSSIYFMEKERNMVNHLNNYYFTNVFTPEELEKIKKLYETQLNFTFFTTKINN